MKVTTKRATKRSMPTTQVMQPTPPRTASALGLSLAVGLIAFAAGCPASTDTTPDGNGGGMVEATFTSLYGDYLGKCKQCHAPSAPGRTSDIEQTLDFSTRATALSTLKTGMATGLTGNHTACNGVPFLAATPDKSLVVAVIDQPTRQAIDLSPQHATCDVDSITDATVKVGSQPSAMFVSALKTWITNGAMDN